MDNSIKDYIFDESSAPEITTLESATDRAAVLLAGLEETFASRDEFLDFVNENATTMQIYGILPPETAMEGAKVQKIRTVVSVQSQLSRATKLAALRLAYANKDPNFDKYIKYRDLMREYRTRIYQKYGNKGKAVARKELRNAGNKAKAISGKQGKQMSDRIQSAIDHADKNGRNGTAINKKR